MNPKRRDLIDDLMHSVKKFTINDFFKAGVKIVDPGTLNNYYDKTHRETPLSRSGIATRLKKGKQWFTEANLADVILESHQLTVSELPSYNHHHQHFDLQEGNPYKDRLHGTFKIQETNEMNLIKIVVLDEDSKLPIDKVVVAETETVAIRNNNDVIGELTARGVIDPAKILKKANKVRSETLDVKLSATMGRDVHLQPIEWQDLTVKKVTV